MKWSLWISKFVSDYCVARGLKPKTIDAYRLTLFQFHGFVKSNLEGRSPDALKAKDILQYIQYLREDRLNGAAAVSRQVAILRGFYKAMVALEECDCNQNPLAHFPKIKAPKRKYSETYSREEIEHLLAAPPTDTVLGLRDRAILMLLYGTGIRASECAGLKEGRIDFEDRTIRVIGKGGHERTIPLNDEVVAALKRYKDARGLQVPSKCFFQSRNGKDISRSTIYERVRKYGRIAKIKKRVSPHRLRHTFATHLVKEGVNLQVIRDLLGHVCISSTQIYIHMTACDLRDAAEKHPIAALVERLDDLLPNIKLPFQKTAFSRSG